MKLTELRCLTLGLAVLITSGALPGLSGADSKALAAASRSVLNVPPGPGPKTITVTDLSDLSPGSLRQAVSNANSGDTINFAPNLSGTASLSYNGEIPIAKDLTIIGPGARNLTITTQTGRIFHITAGKVNISGFTIMSGGIANDTFGDLKVDACAFNHNSTGSSGGGLYNAGRTTVTASTFFLNSAGAKGGAVYNGPNAVLTLQNDTLYSNNAASGGGMVDDGSLAYIINCTIANNLAKSGNGGGMVGGIHTSTISTICAGNSVSNTGTGPDVSGTFESAGYNLISIADGSTGFTKTGDRIGTGGSPFPAQLGGLRDNGGPTDTIAPLSNSAAIDGGLSALAADQRGRAHYDDPAVANAQGGDGSDIGAYETTPSAAWVVTNLADSGAGSLRQAIQDAASGETITFAPGLTGSIVFLLGELTFGKSYNVIGPGANIITLNGNTLSRIFDVSNGVVNLSGLTMTGGNSPGFGGCIFNGGVLTISACTISSSQGGLYGGGLYNSGQLTVKNSSIFNNSSNTDGGGIMNDTGKLIIQNSTVFGNTSQSGGGIYSTGANSTITNCTITNNASSGGPGGGLFCSLLPHVGSSIVAGNYAVNGGSYPDVNGVVSTNGYNLIGNSSGSVGFGGTGDQLGTAAAPKNPVLGTLQNNGGPTPTMALLPGSPAIDAGKNLSGSPTDQRGLLRTFDFPSVPNASGGDTSDIGAYELNASDHFDFNGDGNPDLVAQNSSTQQVAFWFTNGANIIGGAYALSGPGPITLPTNWQVVATGDFNGDGTPDLVLENTSTGQIAFWFTSGNTITGGAYATANGSAIGVPGGWQIVGAGDFNGDGMPDLVLQNTSSQTIVVWTLNGTSVTSGAYVTTGGNPINLPSGWQIVGVGDFNGDGHPDLVLDNPSSGLIAIWLVSGTAVTSGVYVTNGANPILLPAGWAIAAIGDYSGDGKPDLVLQNLNNRTIAFWYLNGTALNGSSYALSGNNIPFGMPAGWGVNGPR